MTNDCLWAIKARQGVGGRRERKIWRCNETFTLLSAVLEQLFQQESIAQWFDTLNDASAHRKLFNVFPPWVSGSFVFSCALHRSWKANSPKVNFLSSYKLTPGGCYSNCKERIMSCVNKPASQC